MRIKMIRDHSFIPPEERRISVEYLAGNEYTVKHDWGEEMVKNGDAKKIDAPPRDQKAD